MMVSTELSSTTDSLIIIRNVFSSKTEMMLKIQLCITEIYYTHAPLLF